MRGNLRYLTSGAIAAMSLFSFSAVAESYVTCKSEGYRYHHCRVSRPGYVRLVRQLSEADCRQGRTWDYDRRGIWVDDGCAARFAVENDAYYDHGDDNHDDHDSGSSAGAALAVIAGAAILGAIVNSHNNADNDPDYKYNDDAYQGGRHTSYVPRWMIGRFKGYNPRFKADVSLNVKKNGRVVARSGRKTVKGYINDDQLHVGNQVFDITRDRNGFYTNQLGDRSNEVRYTRVGG